MKCLPEGIAVEGNELTEKHTRPYIFFRTCEELKFWIPGEPRDCASVEEIVTFFLEHSPAMQFITVTNYIDFQDIENPLQQ